MWILTLWYEGHHVVLLLATVDAGQRSPHCVAPSFGIVPVQSLLPQAVTVPLERTVPRLTPHDVAWLGHHRGLGGGGGADVG